MGKRRRPGKGGTELQWIKLRVDWCRAALTLSDAEAGRFLKSISNFVLTGERPDTAGKDGLLCQMALEHLQGDLDEFRNAAQREADHREHVSRVRSEAAASRWGRREASEDANGCNCMQKDAIADNSMQLHDLHHFAPIGEKEKEKDVSPLPEGNARARDGLGDLLTDEEIKAMQKIEREDMPGIEQTCRFVGMRFTAMDAAEARELLGEYTADQLTAAITSVKRRRGWVTWETIREELKNGASGRAAQKRQNTGGDGHGQGAVRIR